MVAKGKSKGKLRFEVKLKAEETLRLEVIGMAMAYVKLEVTDMSGRRLCESRLTAILGRIGEGGGQRQVRGQGVFIVAGKVKGKGRLEEGNGW